MEIALQSEQIFIANKPVDFRKNILSLCTLVIEEMQKEPSEGIYIFYNKNLDRLKIIGWHRNGFIMLYKVLETGKFLVQCDGDNLQINPEQLNWLLIGVDWRLLSGGKCDINTYF